MPFLINSVHGDWSRAISFLHVGNCFAQMSITGFTGEYAFGFFRVPDEEFCSNAATVTHVYSFLMDTRSRIFMMTTSVTVPGFFPNN